MKIIRLTENNTELFLNDQFKSQLNGTIEYLNLKKLILLAPNVVSIESQYFNQLENLRFLKLNLPKLEVIPAKVFNQLQKLQTLILIVKLVRKIPKEMLIFNFQLQFLKILSNSTFFHAITISYLRHLQYLELKTVQNNPIFMYDSSKIFFEFKRLQTLNLSIYHTLFFRNYTQIISVNLANSLLIKFKFLEEFENLRFLNLKKNFSQLKSINFHQNQSIKTLILSHNHLTTLSSSFLTNLNHLKYLDLTKCFLEHFREPDFALNSPYLAFLSFRNNLLTHLSFKNQLVFQNLIYLQKLDLSFNRLESLPNPDLFCDLIDLKILLLNNNYLYDLPAKCFAKLFRLKFLDLSENFLLDLNWKWFDSRFVYDLEHFDLHLNRIYQIPKKSLKCFPLLKSLNLSFNNIIKLSKHNFKFVPNLKKLNLAFNQLNCLDRKYFLFLNNLEYLNLRNNEIIRIRPATFLHLNYLKVLNLENNQLSNHSVNRLVFQKPFNCFYFRL